MTPRPTQGHMRASPGFSIFEISMVTVIIGLLIGAVLVGIDLMRSAKLQRILTQVDAYNKAVGIFREKYKELPGDLPDATNFWGADTGCPTTPYTATPHKATCDGNGNGHIGDTFTDGGATSYESYRLWQQLANASLIEGAYSGISGTGSANHSIPGVNTPKGPLENSGFNLMYMFMPSGNGSYWGALYSHAITFGGAKSADIPVAPALAPREAYIIETKVDDGRPAYGKVMTFKSGPLPNCTTSDTATVSEYNIAYNATACSLIFITGY